MKYQSMYNNNQQLKSHVDEDDKSLDEFLNDFSPLRKNPEVL